jgi:hypothetical protein
MKSVFYVNLKDKQTVKQFIKMNKGSNDGGDFPKELLTCIYNDIKAEPLRFPVKGQIELSRISADAGEKEGLVFLFMKLCRLCEHWCIVIVRNAVIFDEFSRIFGYVLTQLVHRSTYMIFLLRILGFLFVSQN